MIEMFNKLGTEVRSFILKKRYLEDNYDQYSPKLDNVRISPFTKRKS